MQCSWHMFQVPRSSHCQNNPFFVISSNLFLTLNFCWNVHVQLHCIHYWKKKSWVPKCFFEGAIDTRNPLKNQTVFSNPTCTRVQNHSNLIVVYSVWQEPIYVRNRELLAMKEQLENKVEDKKRDTKMRTSRTATTTPTRLTSPMHVWLENL